MALCYVSPKEIQIISFDVEVNDQAKIKNKIKNAVEFI